MKEMDNLTRDVLAAEAAGFGPWCGRYIAVHGHTSAPEPRKIQEKTAVCKACGAEFIQQKNGRGSTVPQSAGRKPGTVSTK